MRLDHLTNLLNQASARNAGRMPFDPTPTLKSDLPATVPVKQVDGEQVSLSDAARALQHGSEADKLAGAGLDLAQHLLSGLAGQSMSVLGLLKPEEMAGAKISFDSLRYDSSSETSVAVSQQQVSASDGQGQFTAVQQSVALRQAQSAHFAGKGTITTADGRSFDFEAEIDIESVVSQQASQTEIASNDEPADAQTALPADSTKQPLHFDFAGTAAQLLGVLRQPGNAPVADKPRQGFIAVDHSRYPVDLASLHLGVMDISLLDSNGQPLGMVDWQRLLGDLVPWVQFDGAASKPPAKAEGVKPAVVPAPAPSGESHPNSQQV